MSRVWVLRRIEQGSALGTYNMGVYVTLAAAMDAASHNASPRPVDPVALTWWGATKDRLWATQPVIPQDSIFGRTVIYRAERFEIKEVGQ